MKRTLQDVYANPIFGALYPEGLEFMTARRLPSSFEEAGIDVTALVSFGVFPHIKTIPAAQMMLEDFKNGLYEGKHTMVVDSSGNTAHAVARLARAFAFKMVKVVLSKDVPESKKGILAALPGVELIEVGEKVSERAQEEGRRPGHVHLDQYKHMGNVHGHELYTGPEIVRVLGQAPRVITIAMGSGGTACGVGRFFRANHPDTLIIGVRPRLGERVPGARDKKKMEEDVTLPWEEVVDVVIEETRKDSFIAMRRLWRDVEPQPGPTSGLAFVGLEEYLEICPPETLRRFTGGIAAFLCPDDGRFYSERTTGELDPDQ